MERALASIASESPAARLLPTTDRHALVGRSAAILAVREAIARYAPSSAPVVVTGESGTGKEIVARALHDASPRARRPFVAVNAAGIDGTLLGTELFGHERGAFTGAEHSHRGLFEQAHEGTLFLDEIGELPLPAQAQLLRVLETGEVRAVGSERVRRVSIRIVVATHRDLAVMVREGQFRADVFYRLHVLAIEVPPLRSRLDDIPLLVEHFLGTMERDVGIRCVSRLGLQALACYGWPGNVRELRNVLHRAALLTHSPSIDADTIRAVLAPQAASEARTRAAIHSDAAIASVVEESHGNVSLAARKLGVARSTLRGHLARYRLEQLARDTAADRNAP